MTNSGSLYLSLTENCRPLAAEIAAVTRAAFEKEYGSDEGEARIIEALRAAGDVVVELAALADGVVIGHAIFSRLTVDPPDRIMAALGPVCARVDRQRGGVGSTLIREGLVRCAAKGCHAVAVLGDPSYYGRFGFTLAAAEVVKSEYSGDHFQALALRPGALDGGPWRVAYPRAFSESG